MATALDLLMSTKEDVNLFSEESDICTIDAKTRAIFVPSTIIVGGVQSDKNAERIKFSCPKIVGDNLDLSKFSVRINFENVSSVDFNVSIKDQYICDDVAVDGENVTFSWLIGRNAARYMGTVRFIVCAVKTDSDSNLSVEWNTSIAEVPVLEGIEIDQPQIGQEEKDVINQLLELTKNTSAEAVQNVNSAKEQAIKDIQSVSQPDTTLTIEGGIAEAKATGEAIGSLKEDLSDIDYIVFKDKINKLTFNSEGSSSNITLNGNTITSINATKEQYKAFINTSLFENGKKYIVVMKFKNDSSTNITVYANAFSYAFQGSIGKTQSLGIGKSETSVMPYTGKSDIRGFSIYSTTENASYTVDIYIYDVTDKDISNIDFSVGGTKIKILKSDLEKPYFGKILCTYGDSITAQQTWQDYVQRELGFSKYYNHGVGGRRLMAMATDECLAEITEDFDVILVMGGTNDWAQDRTIGAENDINTDDQTFTGTFYGGLNALMKKLTTKYPTKRIVFMTQTPVKNSNGENFFLKKGSADGLKNSNGNTTRDFAKATLNACGNNHVPCIDLNSLVGWNENNISSFVLNENDMFFHPTSIGGKRMAECISGFLESIQSI